MSKNRSALLLSFLYGQAAEDKCGKLGDLFQTAVRRSESCQKLIKRLNLTVFLGNQGRALREQADDLLQQSMTQTQDIVRKLNRMDALNQTISREVEESEKNILSPAFFTKELPAVSAENFDTYKKFYQTLAGSICCYLLSQYGVDGIQELTYDPQAGLPELMVLVNGLYADALLRSADRPAAAAWRIVRTTFNGDNLIGYEGWALQRPGMSLDEMRRRVKKGEYEQLTSCCFTGTDPEAGVLLAGVGNLIGVPPAQGWRLLNSQIVTRLPADRFRIMPDSGRTLLQQLQENLDTDCYCISPEELLRVLNRVSLDTEVSQRMAEGACLFCGKKPPHLASKACADHFNLNR